jgi:hypothetical protein
MSLEKVLVNPQLKPLFPRNPLPEDLPPLSRQEQRERVDVLERLSEFDDLEKEIKVVRKLLLERLNQLPERN